MEHQKILNLLDVAVVGNRPTWCSFYKGIGKISTPITMRPFLPYFLYLEKNFANANFHSTDHLFRYLNYFKRVKGRDMNHIKL